MEGTRRGEVLSGSVGLAEPEVRSGAIPTVVSEVEPVGTSDAFSRTLPGIVGGARPVISHPLLCREMPSDLSSATLESFTADFDCRLEAINGHIAAGRLTEAARESRELNASWRAFNTAHREIPASDRRALLGRLYLVQATLERARGPHRETYALHFEARGYDHMGNHARARLGYREFLRSSEGTEDPYVSEYREVSLERRRALELEAVDRLTTVSESILAQRESRLITDAFYGFAENQITTDFLTRVRGRIESGESATLDDAIASLRESHLSARRAFEENPVIGAGSRVRVWREVDSVLLAGGTLHIVRTEAPLLMTVTVGREGGVIVTAGGSYHFPPSDREVRVETHGGLLSYRDAEGRLLHISHESAVCRWSVASDSPVSPDTGPTRESPNTLDQIFDGEGGWQSIGVFTFDEFLIPMIEMETEEGLERLSDDDERGEYLIEIAGRMRSRSGSYGVAAACLEEVFAGEYERALEHVLTNRGGEVAELRTDAENTEEYEADLMVLVAEQMETWRESGELAASDPDAARAWEAYNDMLDPANQFFNMADESQDAMVDEVIITGITFIPAIGLGARAARVATGVRAVRLIAAGASVGARRLLMRFGPRIAAIGARSAHGLVLGTAATTTRVAVEAPFMTTSSGLLSGRGLTVDSAVDGSLHAAGHLGIYHVVGAALPRPLRFAAESFLGRELGEWASGSAARRLGVRLYFGGGSLTAMTGTATALSYADSTDDRTFADRVAGETARMGYMTFLGGLAGEGGARSEGSRGPTLLADLRSVAGDVFRGSGDFARGVALAPMWLAVGGGGPGGFGVVSIGGGRRSGGVPTPVLGEEFRGMPASYRSRPVRVEGGSVAPLETAPRARLIERLDTDITSEGSTAGIFRAEMTVGGEPREVAVKVFRNPQPHPVEGTVEWEPTLTYADRELANLEILAGLGLGPRPHGMVRVDGNIAIAMDRIGGRAIDEMTPSEVRRFVSEGTFRQLGEMWQRLLDAGYEISDFQFAVLTRNQVVDGRSMLAGDVIFWDAGGLRPISEFRAEAEFAGLAYTPCTAAEIVAAARETAEMVLEAETTSVEDRPTMPPPSDMPSFEPRPVVAAGPITASLPRSATAVGLAVRHANAHLADTTGFRFAIESSLRNRGEAGVAPVEVDVWVAGPEAEAAFLETIRNSSSRVNVEALGGDEYLVRDADRGDSVVTIRHGLELSVAQQTHLGEWLRDVPPAERVGISLTRYSRPRLESLVDHLIGRGWNQSQLEGLFTDRGFTAEETAAIIGPRVSLSVREGRSGGGAL